MSCKYCKIKMRPIDEDMKVLKGESWGDEHGEGGYIGQMYDDKFRMLVSYDAGYACTGVDNIKYCPFCGAELTMPKEPLIKDEKIRKAVRAWAEANDVGVAKVAPFAVFDIESSARIYFYGRVIEDKDYDEEKSYTIAELCGEEEQ